MSYVSIEKQIQSVPEEYLEEVSMYIDYVLFKAGRKKEKAEISTSSFFGCIKRPVDGLEIQRSMRNEWH